MESLFFVSNYYVNKHIERALRRAHTLPATEETIVSNCLALMGPNCGTEDRKEASNTYAVLHRHQRREEKGKAGREDVKWGVEVPHRLG